MCCYPKPEDLKNKEREHINHSSEPIEFLASNTRRAETRKATRLAGALAVDFQFCSLEEVYSTGLSAFLAQVLEQLDQISNMVVQAFFRTSGYSTSVQSSSQSQSV